MSINSRLKEVMECKGLNIKTFAELLDVPYRTLQNYLLNERAPGAEILIKISNTLNINLNWLMCGEESMFRTHLGDDLTGKELDLINHYRMVPKNVQIAFDVLFKILSNNIDEA